MYIFAHCSKIKQWELCGMMPHNSHDDVNSWTPCWNNKISSVCAVLLFYFCCFLGGVLFSFSSSIQKIRFLSLLTSDESQTLFITCQQKHFQILILLLILQFHSSPCHCLCVQKQVLVFTTRLFRVIPTPTLCYVIRLWYKPFNKHQDQKCLHWCILYLHAIASNLTRLDAV